MQEERAPVMGPSVLRGICRMSNETSSFLFQTVVNRGREAYA